MGEFGGLIYVLWGCIELLFKLDYVRRILSKYKKLGIIGINAVNLRILRANLIG